MAHVEFIEIPGTTVTAVVVGTNDYKAWGYRLYDGHPTYTHQIAAGQFKTPERVTSEQVARIAYLLEVEYK